MKIPFLNRRLLAPEVVQTSAMDCGPASLKCLLEGLGVPVSYGRLREACQTDVDGTSIDTMEEVAAQLGLDAEQVMVPADHALLAESKSLPAIAVVRLANGLTHFVVVWRAHGRFVQVMDPGVGRRWIPREQFLRELYIHTATIPAQAWREWAESASFLDPLRRRLRQLGITRGEIEASIELALADAGWRTLAALDAATRMVTSVVQAGGLARGGEAARVLKQFAERGLLEIGGAPVAVPANYWMVTPAGLEEDGQELIHMRGAVFVQAKGRRDKSEENEARPPLSPELAAALKEKPSRPGRELFRLIRQDGLLTPLALLVAIALAAGGVIFESVLFQGLFALGGKLAPTEQRIGAMGALIAFAAALLLLEWPLASKAMKMGRGLETRLRVAFLEKTPRLGDRYFQSRLISDMAERSHSAQFLRQLPPLGVRFMRLVCELALTTAGLIWLDPAGAWLMTTVAVAALTLPIALQSRLTERDLRIRNHNGALSRFYLDAMLGLTPIRAHGAERSVRLEHESLLVEWMRAGYDYLRSVVAAETAQGVLGFGLAAWLLFNHLSRSGAGVSGASASLSGGLLLLVYWALNLPALGQEIALLAQQYPSQRNVTLRLLEPLGAPEEEPRGDGATGRRGDKTLFTAEEFRAEAAFGTIAPSPSSSSRQSALSINFENVGVRAGGRQILENFDLRIEAGSHVAVVGPSGAGKSTFVGLLLGWHRPADGGVSVDGQKLTGERLQRLRQETAWVDPAVQLWNRTFIDNLQYGSAESAPPHFGAAIESADLRRVLEKLPDGLQTVLGEGGGLISGGEGQRVRFGRALLKTDARLVILDEPFRGLDREKRRALLSRARELWRGATLICITHDVGETMEFDRVLVMDKGRIVEDAPAPTLASRQDSLYRALLNDEEVVRAEMWSSGVWRRLRVDGGRLIEDVSHPEAQQTVEAKAGPAADRASTQAAHMAAAATNGHYPQPRQTGDLIEVR